MLMCSFCGRALILLNLATLWDLLQVGMREGLRSTGYDALPPLTGQYHQCLHPCPRPTSLPVRSVLFSVVTIDMNPNARLQTLLISRFLLNLRKSQEPPPLASRPSRITMSGFRLPTFPEIVGDMGQPPDHAVGEEEQVMEEARTCHSGRASTNTSAPCA